MTRLLPALTVAVVLAAAGCGTPEGSRDGYRGEAAITVQAAQSQVTTVQIVLTALTKNGILATCADDTVTGSEQALAGMIGTFTALQPPPVADDLRDTATTALSHAQDAVAEARIATRRHDRHQVQDALNAVTAAGQELDTVYRRLAPGAPQ